MKITKEKLRLIIKEELEQIITEQKQTDTSFDSSTKLQKNKNIKLGD